MRCADLFVKKIEFKSYRNLKDSQYIPSRGVNVICGSNAQGKTNLVECIWLFTGGRSFRGSNEKDIISFGQSNAKIKAEFFAEGRDQIMEISIEKGRRKATLNGLERNYLSEIIGTFCAVVFSPDHLTLVKNGPEERRSFLDGAICQIYPLYAAYLSRYKKALNERNALLKSIPSKPYLRETIDVWDEGLASAGARVALKRINYINQLTENAVSIYDGISSGKEKLKLEYRMSYDTSPGCGLEELYEKNLKALKEKREEDISCGFTTTGIHRDDLIIKINDRPARSFGSQGQQRSAVLSLKLAEAALLGIEKGETPVILLDDVLSELDPSRQNFLLTRLGGMQVFITCCEKNINSESVVYMKDGMLSAEE